jgi:hypothetical protein
VTSILESCPELTVLQWEDVTNVSTKKLLKEIGCARVNWIELERVNMFMLTHHRQKPLHLDGTGSGCFPKEGFSVGEGSLAFMNCTVGQ